MKQVVVRYRTKPERVDENTRLIEQVFRELHARAPDGVRYLALKLDDGTFVHFAVTEDGALAISELEAFRAFQGGIKERCLDPPRPCQAMVVGNYPMLGE